MKVLLIHSGNAVADSSQYTFVKEQGDALERMGVRVCYYAVKGKGWKGYLKNLHPLESTIEQQQPDVIHAHYGLCGLLASMAKKRVPLVVTFHNGEVLSWWGNLLSSIAAICADYNIFVGEHIRKHLFYTAKRYAILPCGVDLERFKVIDKNVAMGRMGLSGEKLNVLFGGAFDNERKNAELATKALNVLKKEVNLIEMKGWSRDDVAMLLCGCDMLLLTSISEGSPQIVKEALACNCPIVSTNVGDVAKMLKGVEGCYVTTFEIQDVAEKVQIVLERGKRINGRSQIEQLQLDNDCVAKHLKLVYNELKNGKA